MGIDVIVAQHGVEALDILKSSGEAHPFDLVISDHLMPQMSGVDLIKKSHKLFPDLPYILASGYSKDNLDEELVGCDNLKAVLKKPLKRELLQQKIFAILSNRLSDSAAFLSDAKASAVKAD